MSGTFFRGLKGPVDTVTDILGTMNVVPFLSYRFGKNMEKIRLFGRVQENRSKHPDISGNDDELMDELKSITNEINEKKASMEINPNTKPNAEVELSIDNFAVYTSTDKDGFYDTVIDSPEDLPKEIEDSLLTGKTFLRKLNNDELPEAVPFGFEIISPNPDNIRFGVITELDDTILQCNDKEPIKVFYNTIFGTIKHRQPVNGTSEFYNSLHGNEKNPFFYISNSPCSLYPRLYNSITQNWQFPKGPIMLNNLNIKELSESMHKENTIHRILNDYDNLKFVIIGTTDEKDLQVYQNIIEEKPNQIDTVILRDLGNIKSSKKVNESIGVLDALPIRFHLVSNHEDSKTICKTLGLIQEKE